MDDRYEATEGTVLLSGIEALVRLLLTQRRLDRLRHLSTALFISGYEGSPLGGLDQQLQRAHDLLAEADIVFVPGLNEELAATAVGGTQLDRRAAGTAGRRGGRLLVREEPRARPGGRRHPPRQHLGHRPRSAVPWRWWATTRCRKSSTLPSSCEQMARALGVPVLAPASVADIIPLGLHAVALSRYAGLWSALKIVADIADASATVTLPALGDARHPAPGPDPALAPADPGRARVRSRSRRTSFSVRIPRVHEYTELAGLNRITSEPVRPRLAILASGMAYAATLRALSDLGLGAARSGRPRPASGQDRPALAAQPVRPAGHGPTGCDEVLVVEDKAPVVEEQLKAALYRQPRQPLHLRQGATDGGRSLIPRHGAVTTDLVAKALARTCGATSRCPPPVRARRGPPQPHGPDPHRPGGGEAPAPRTPYFCSGCPHNISTRADDDQLVGLGIGCHIMAALDDEGRGHKVGMTQMGGEGAQWIGMSPFTDDRALRPEPGRWHLLPLRLPGRPERRGRRRDHDLQDPLQRRRRHDGWPDPGRARWACPSSPTGWPWKGVKKVIITTPDPGELAARRPAPHRHRGPPGRDGATRSASWRASTGVTALIHHDPCAAEERRLRNRGQRPALTESVWINSRVCEGCGDCAEQSTCMSLVHVDTEFGTKMSVHQGSCNLDRSCVKGECPSFVIARHGSRARRAPAADVPHAARARLPDPPDRRWSGTHGHPHAGHRGDRRGHRLPHHRRWRRTSPGCTRPDIDQTGLAQKGGPVTSDVRISSSPITGDVHASPGGADLLLGFDLLGAAGDDALRGGVPRAHRGRPQRGRGADRLHAPPPGHHLSPRGRAAGAHRPIHPFRRHGVRRRPAIAERLTGRSPGGQPGPRRRRLPGRAPAVRRPRAGRGGPPQRRRRPGQLGRHRLGTRGRGPARCRGRCPCAAPERRDPVVRPTGSCRPTWSPTPTWPDAAPAGRPAHGWPS